MKKRILLVFFGLLLSNATVFSQAKTDVNKDIDITKVYEQVVKEGYGTPKVYKKLANAYYFRSEYVDARKWFEKLFEVEKPTDETLLYRYRQTLKALKVDLSTNVYLSVASQDIDR